MAAFFMTPLQKPMHRIIRTMTTGPAASRHWKTILALLILAVSYLALTPKPPQVIDTGWDKLNHALAFTALTFSASLCYPLAPHRRTYALLVLFAYGGLIEVLQAFVPGRAGEWGDLVADTVGIACGAITAASVRRAASVQPSR
jgi:VanZ family protein